MHGSNAGTGAHFDQSNGHALSGGGHAHHKSLNSPTTAPSLNEKYGVGSSHVVGGGSGHQIHGSYHNGGSNNSRAPQISLGSHHGPLSSLQSPTNNFGGRDRQNSHHGGYHNFHPMQPDANASNNTGHSIIHGSGHFNQFNVRDRDNNGQPRHMVGASLDSVNLMQSNDSSIGAAVANNNSN
jgi:hypothetical protein